MNPGQTKFYEFMLARTKVEHLTDMKELLAEAFEKAAAGEQTPEFFAAFNKTVAHYLNPESLAEVQQAMAIFQKGK